MSPARAAVAALLLSVTALAACGSTKENTVTPDEAVARVAAYAQEAFGQLPAGATLKQTLHTPDVPCDDGDDTVFVETRYDVAFDENWPVDESMTKLADYWTANGYRIVRDDRDSADFPELVVERKTDGFHIGYLIVHAAGGKVTAQLLSSSPCYEPGPADGA